MTARLTDGRSLSSMVINRAAFWSVSRRNGGELRGTESVYRRSLATPESVPSTPMTTESTAMSFYDNPEAVVALDLLPREGGVALIGARALALAERLFGAGLAIRVAAPPPR